MRFHHFLLEKHSWRALYGDLGGAVKRRERKIYSHQFKLSDMEREKSRVEIKNKISNFILIYRTIIIKKCKCSFSLE